jgi:hypothetical protein
MVSFGIVLASLGASLPHVISRFRIDKRDAGALLSLLSFSVLAGSLVFGRSSIATAHISGTALSVVMTMALAGGMLMPYAAGVLGAAHGLRTAFLLVPIALVVLALQLASLSRRIAATPVAALSDRA